MCSGALRAACGGWAACRNGWCRTPEGCLHAGLGRATDAYAALLGELGVGGVFCRERDPQAKGAVERFQGYLETSFEPARRFVNERDFQAQLDAWVDERANQRLHGALRGSGRSSCSPRSTQRWRRCRCWSRISIGARSSVSGRIRTCASTRVDYSLDPRLVGQRIETRISQTRILAVARATGEIAVDHRRSYAKHRTITDARHQDTLEAMRAERLGARIRPSDGVERRDLAAYSTLIPA